MSSIEEKFSIDNGGDGGSRTGESSKNTETEPKTDLGLSMKRNVSDEESKTSEDNDELLNYSESKEEKSEIEIEDMKKRPLTTDDHDRKRRFVTETEGASAFPDRSVSEDRDIPSLDLSNTFPPTHGPTNPFDPRRFEPLDRRQSILVQVTVPRSVHNENMLNNADPTSCALATIRSATSITLLDEDDPPGFAGGHADQTDAGGGNNDDHRTSQAGLVSPAFLPLCLKYIKLEELLLASETWTLSSVNNLPPIKPGTPADGLTRMDLKPVIHFIYDKTIDQHRVLSAFRRLSREDRQALMTARFRDLVTTRFAIKYDSRSGNSTVGYPGLREYPSDKKIKTLRNGYYHYHMSSLRSSFPENYRSNQSVLVILSAIALFNTEGVGLQNTGFVKEQQAIYRLLLKDYLHSTFGEREAASSYRHLLTWANLLSMFVKAQDGPVVKIKFDPESCELSTLEIIPIS